MALTELSSSANPFDFASNESAQSSFKALKQALTSAPVLAIPGEDKPYEMVCDACGYGIGAVLMHEQRPIAYYSYKLNSVERNYPTRGQELLAVTKSFEHWRCHLKGCRGGVTVVTDRMPNRFLDTKPAVQLSQRQVGWRQFLSHFECVWECRKGAYIAGLQPLNCYYALRTLCYTHCPLNMYTSPPLSTPPQSSF